MLALLLGAATSACSALDRSLDDPGDDALVADASSRAQAPVVDPAAYARRSVDFRIEATGTGAPSATAVSEDGGCGWSEQWVRRSSLGGGTTELGSDDANRRWTVLAVATEAAAGAPGAGESGGGGGGGDQVRDAVLRGAFQQGWEHVEVELEGQVEIAASGLAARFTGTGAQAPVPDGVVEVSCGPTP